MVSARDYIAWSYSNLARARAALADGRTKYIRTDHMIRARLFKGLRTGALLMRSIFDDEKLKYQNATECAYCGSATAFSLDHLLPRSAGGGDQGENLVIACRSCNSSKGAKNLLDWYAVRCSFPPLLVLRRYMKLTTRFLDKRSLLDQAVDDLPPNLPLNIRGLPTKFPPLSELRL